VGHAAFYCGGGRFIEKLIKVRREYMCEVGYYEFSESGCSWLGGGAETAWSTGSGRFIEKLI